MDVFVTILLFLVGIVLVIKGGDIFVDGAGYIAKALKVPTFIIGATIVSIATTMPEMIVSIMAATEGKNDMAIGNAVGSVTANTALILAVAMIAMSIICDKKDFIIQCILLICSASVLLVSSLGGELNIWGSAVLFAIFVAFMIVNIANAKQENPDEEKTPINKKQLIKNIVFFVLGGIAIALGSRLLVDNGSKIASMIGIPERIIAITLIAIGTSLPELITTITAIAKKQSGLSAGNIIGANIIDLCLILPLCSLVSGNPIPVSSTSISIDMPVCLIFCIIALVPTMIRKKSSKVQGIILIIAYILYLVFSVIH